MIIGIPKERKPSEARVAVTPEGVFELTKNHIPVLIETQAGILSGFEDQAYHTAGAQIVDSAVDLYDQAELIVKSGPPTDQELAYLKKEHLLFCPLHLVVNPALAKALSNIGCMVLAFEQLYDQGQLPLLVPMSAIAGRVAVQVGHYLLAADTTEESVLLGSEPSQEHQSDLNEVVVLGAGVAGWYAVQAACDLGAHVQVFDQKAVALTKFSQLGEQVKAQMATPEAIQVAVQQADVVVGCILNPGEKTHPIVPETWIKSMKPGAVVVDLSIDQGGCFATSRPMSLDQPTYQVHGITHVCVTNLPAIVPETASQVLSNALVPYLVHLVHADIETDRVFKTALVNLGSC